MANKIVIQFTENPTDGLGFTYYSMIFGYKIPYTNGLTDVLITYLPFGGAEALFTDIAIESTLSKTIDKTIQRLKDNYINDKVSYTRVSNTIEIFINVDCQTTITETNPSLIGTVEDLPIIFPDLKYYIKWDDYFLSIRQKDYQGFSTEIFGNVVLKKGNVEEILDPIRGTGLNIDLEATPSLTFDEFLIADEMTYTVQLKKGNQTIFNGFIKPDGVQQSYVSDIWLVNIEVIDGLGALKDLSFVYPDGSQFIGNISMFDTIKGCLDRTGSLMTINSSIELNYIGYAGTNILKDTYINSARFIKNDGTTIMDCNSVLTSILNLLSAVIMQENGQWWIYRPNDLKLNTGTTFIDNTTGTTFIKNLSYVLGSQIDGFYPHHCEANQQIEVKGAISAYRLNYEYGILDGILKNGKLNHNSSLIYPDWTIYGPNFSSLINDPLSPSGLKIIPNTNPVTKYLLATSGSILVTADYKFTFRATIKANGVGIFGFRVRLENYYMNSNGEWGTTPVYISYSFISYNNETITNTIEVISQDLPIDGLIYIEIYVPERGVSSEWATVCEINSINLVPINKSSKVGEFHTVSRKNPPSSITKENQTVYNGDGSNSLIGSIYKTDKITLTDLWARKGKFEQYPLLRISAEDDLRIKRNPIKVFSGSILGQLPYLSIISINNILGLFMFTEYTYDFRTKKINAKLTQFYNDELGDIDYELSYNYGNNTIKPTIKG